MNLLDTADVGNGCLQVFTPRLYFTRCESHLDELSTCSDSGHVVSATIGYQLSSVNDDDPIARRPNFTENVGRENHCSRFPSSRMRFRISTI